jgi:putative NADPH-quinone reductase
MRVSIILAHPDPGSFNHAIAEKASGTLESNGHDVVFHDLYREGFDPVLTQEEIPKTAPLGPVIQNHCEEIHSADGIIIIHPNWWGMPPAILKGWVDRVIRPGVAYEFLEGDDGEGVPCGRLLARTAIVFNTSNTDAMRERNNFGDPLQSIWEDCIFGLCGVANFHRRMFSVMVTSDSRQRIAWLDEVGNMVDEYFPAKKVKV